MSAAPAVRVVLFDIDGTLITTGGASDRAWHRAFEELHGVEVEVSEYTGRGVPDPAVGVQSFRGAIGREPTAEEMDALMALRLRYLPEEVGDSPGYRVMPGAEALLGQAARGWPGARPDHRQRRGGRSDQARAGRSGPLLRVRRLRLRRARARRRRPHRARARRRVAGSPVDRAACLAVGDTPRDVEAGHGAGIRVIGVATGSYSVDELRDAGADFAIPTLEGGLPLEGSG